MSHRGAGPGVGFRVSGAGALLTLRESTSMDDLIGVPANTGGVLRISNSILVGDGAAAAKAGGVVESFGDNIFRANNIDALDVLTPALNL